MCACAAQTVLTPSELAQFTYSAANISTFQARRGLFASLIIETGAMVAMMAALLLTALSRTPTQSSWPLCAPTHFLRTVVSAAQPRKSKRRQLNLFQKKKKKKLKVTGGAPLNKSSTEGAFVLKAGAIKKGSV